MWIVTIYFIVLLIVKNKTLQKLLFHDVSQAKQENNKNNHKYSNTPTLCWNHTPWLILSCSCLKTVEIKQDKVEFVQYKPKASKWGKHTADKIFQLSRLSQEEKEFHKEQAGFWKSS